MLRRPPSNRVLRPCTTVRHIDTAQGYDNEEETGQSIEKSGVKGTEVWVTSKLSQEGGATDKPSIPVESVRESVLSTISRLGFQPSLLLVHNPFVPAPGQLVPFWKELEKLKDSGELTAELGVSNFRPQDIEELVKEAKYFPVVNQLEYHPFVLTHLAPVLALHAKHNIITEAYGPLSPILRHPTKGGPLIPILDRIVNRLNKDSPEDGPFDQAAVLLLWTHANGVVAVTASGNEERIGKSAKVQKFVAEGKGLTQEEVKEIEKVGKGIHFRAYDEHMSVDFPAPDLPEK